jgi:hypothetical protein
MAGLGAAAGTRLVNMEEGGSSAARPQVIYILQSKAPKSSIKETYATNIAAVLGCLHLLCGVVALASDIVGIFAGNVPVATGIWSAVFFLVTGSLAIAGARSGSRCLVAATLVMAILSAVSAGVLLIMSSIFFTFDSYCRYSSFGCDTKAAIYIIEIVIGAVLLVAGVVSAALTCRPLCCSPAASTGTVHYHPEQTAASSLLGAEHTTIKLPALPTGLGTGAADKPPAYKDVAEDGANYQRF